MPASVATAPASLFMEACSCWNAMKIVADRARATGDGAFAAAMMLLGGHALETVLKAVLAASGWSPGALERIARDVEAAWQAALDCGLMPRLSEETRTFVVVIREMHLAAPGTRDPAAIPPEELERAVSLIGGLIVDVGEQFSSIGHGLGRA